MCISQADTATNSQTSPMLDVVRNFFVAVRKLKIMSKSISYHMRISFILILFATLSLILHLLNIATVLLNDKSIIDYLPQSIYGIVLFSYPVFLTLSYFFYTLSKHLNDKFKIPVITLMITNGIGLIIILTTIFCSQDQAP